MNSGIVCGNGALIEQKRYRGFLVKGLSSSLLQAPNCEEFLPMHLSATILVMFLAIIIIIYVDNQLTVIKLHVVRVLAQYICKLRTASLIASKLTRSMPQWHSYCLKCQPPSRVWQTIFAHFQNRLCFIRLVRLENLSSQFIFLL